MASAIAAVGAAPDDLDRRARPRARGSRRGARRPSRRPPAPRERLPGSAPGHAHQTSIPSSCSFATTDSLVNGFIRYSSAPASSACDHLGHLGLGGDHHDPGGRAVGRLADRRDELDARSSPACSSRRARGRARGPHRAGRARGAVGRLGDLDAQLAQHPAEDHPHRARVVDHSACIVYLRSSGRRPTRARGRCRARADSAASSL